MMNEELKISIFDSGDFKVVRLNEDIQVYNANTFKNTILRILKETDGVVIIDLYGISLLDSAGYGALMVLQMQTPGRRLGLANVNAEIQKVMSLTSLNQLFNFYVGNQKNSYQPV